MRANHLFLIIVSFVLSTAGCRGPEGPMGPAGPSGDPSSSLSDPAIMPRVIYSFPAANSQGPYPGLSGPRYFSFEVRFNKFMNLSSLRHAFSFFTDTKQFPVDTGSIYSYGGDLFRINTGWRYNGQNRWEIGTRYHLKIDSTAMDVNGNHLWPSADIVFTPEPAFRVVAVSPSEGQTITSFISSVWIYFNSAVDSGIFPSLHINPPLPGQWELDPYGYDSTSVRFRVDGQPQEGTTYTISVDAGGTDRDGHALPAPFLSHFSILPFSIVYTYPDSTSAPISMNGSISLYFSNSVDTSTWRTAVQIAPHTELMSWWGSNFSNVQVSPRWNFPPEAVCSLKVGTALKGAAGQPIAAPYTLLFRTRSFVVSYSYPQDGELNFGLTQSIYFSFSGYIDTVSMLSAFSLHDSSGAAVPGYFPGYYSTPQSSATFQPLAALKPNARYSFTVSTAQLALGGYHLKNPYTVTFRTGSQ